MTEGNDQSRFTDDEETLNSGRSQFSSDSDRENIQEERRGPSTKLVLGLLLLAFITYVIVDSFTTRHVEAVVDAFIQWFEDNTLCGAFLFIGIYAVFTTVLIPGSLLTLGAGFVFTTATSSLGLGVVIACSVVLVGAWIGAIGGFLVGRYLLRDVAARLAQKYILFEAIDIALKEEGLKIFLLLRLSPIIPFGVMNYLGGVSAVSFRDYCTSLVGLIPVTILYVFLGASAGSVANGGDSDSTATVAVAVVGSAVGIAGICVTTQYAKRELDRIVAEKEGKGVETEPLCDDDTDESVAQEYGSI